MVPGLKVSAAVAKAHSKAYEKSPKERQREREQEPVVPSPPPQPLEGERLLGVIAVLSETSLRLLAKLHTLVYVHIPSNGRRSLEKVRGCLPPPPPCCALFSLASPRMHLQAAPDMLEVVERALALTHMRVHLHT